MMHILVPAKRQGWSTSVVADVTVPGTYAETFRRRVQTELKAVRACLLVVAGGMLRG